MPEQTGMTDEAIESLKRMASDIRPQNLDRDPLLRERQSTHGSFADNAVISQTLKAAFKKHNKGPINMIHAEALDMIALKLSRVLSGQAMFKDHWDDIAGYAKLASEACHD